MTALDEAIHNVNEVRHYEPEQDELAIVKWLWNRSPQSVRDKALHTAILKPDVNAVKWIFLSLCTTVKKLDVNWQDKDSYTALHHAAREGNTEAFKELFKYRNIKVDEYNRHRATPLYGAARRGRLDVVKLLLENGANPNLRTVVRIDLPPKSGTYPDLSAAIRVAGSTALIDGNSPIDVANRRHKTECRKLMEEYSEKHNEQLSMRAYPSVSESEPEELPATNAKGDKQAYPRIVTGADGETRTLTPCGTGT